MFFRFTLLAHFARRGCAKHRLSKFKGISKENFYLHLKDDTKMNQEISTKKLLKLI